MSNMSDSEKNLFELKYLEEISNLFNEFKGMDNYYGLDLFKNDFTEYFDFIKQNVVIQEFPDIETSDDEFYET